MIAPGTLCLIVAPHSLAGRCCTVRGLCEPGTLVFPVDATRQAAIVDVGDEFYRISVDVPCPRIGWVAHRRCLVPIASPDITTDERKHEPVAA